MPQRSTYTPLADPLWQYVEKVSLEEFSRADWAQLNAQRAAYAGLQQASQALRLLSASEHDPSFGYMVNNYRHSLQSATMVLRDGRSEEDVVVALLHDVGFITCPLMHGDFAAALMGAYVSERNHWMLRNHAVFQNFHAHHLSGIDRHEREQWRGHPFFDWTAEFVKLYDQATCDPHYPSEPIETFIPMIESLLNSVASSPSMDESCAVQNNRV